MLFVISLGRGQKSIHPGQQALGAVVGVEDNGDSVLFGHGTNVESTTDGTGNGSSVVGVIKSLSTIELRATGRKLDDDGSIVSAGRFQAGVDTGGTDTVNGGDSVAYIIKSMRVHSIIQRRAKEAR